MCVVKNTPVSVLPLHGNTLCSFFTELIVLMIITVARSAVAADFYTCGDTRLRNHIKFLEHFMLKGHPAIVMNEFS